MSVEFELDGLEELRQELLKLPYELAQEAADRITFRTAVANTQIASRYARRKGKLRGGLRVKVEVDGASVVGTVTNTSKIAYIYENGTQARHNDLGNYQGRDAPGPRLHPGDGPAAPAALRRAQGDRGPGRAGGVRGCLTARPSRRP